MKPWCAASIGLVLAALAVVSRGSASASTHAASEERSPERVRLLDVPYVPQSGVLCGGAALAMVLRYWGLGDALAEDFAALVLPGESAIRTDVLVDAAQSHRCVAFPSSGNPDAVLEQLEKGRPVIALIRASHDTFHYVVLVGWAQDRVIVHDPKLGPFRTRPRKEFVAAWAASGYWSLLILPSPELQAPSASDSADVSPLSILTPSRCDSLVAKGVLLAEGGDLAGAECELRAAESLCPSSAAPLRELAGLRFRTEDWNGAIDLAERALALAPTDAYSQRLLAGSRFLSGDAAGALEAWNRLGEPRADVMRIDGLKRVRYSAVAGQLGLPTGRLLTPRAFGRAERRLRAVPAQSEQRLCLQPLPGGSARVNVTLLERPLLFAGRWDLARVGIRAAVRQEVVLDVASPTGNGELWSLGWRWFRERPRLSLRLAVPAPRGRPGIWQVDGFWERQAYARLIPADASDTAITEVYREERRSTALSFSDWLGPDLRVTVGAGLDEWTDRGTFGSAAGRVETRWARNRLLVGAEAATWVSVEPAAPFEQTALFVQWCSNGIEACDAWHAEVGMSHATSQAPLALWSGAGTGNGRDPFLRAHPLLNAGVVESRVFGRTLAHVTIERQEWPWTIGPLRLGWALFVDAAKPWDTTRPNATPWQVDGGTGVRLRSLGMSGHLRVDAARGFEDGHSALSVGWQVP